jgi:uncharacterized membrane-anchored protein
MKSGSKNAVQTKTKWRKIIAGVSKFFIAFYVIDICIFLLREIQSTFYLKDCVIYTVHLRISLALLFKINKYRLKQTEKCYKAG